MDVVLEKMMDCFCRSQDFFFALVGVSFGSIFAECQPCAKLAIRQHQRHHFQIMPEKNHLCYAMRWFFNPNLPRTWSSTLVY
jgi:hypothetical protein